MQRQENIALKFSKNIFLNFYCFSGLVAGLSWFGLMLIFYPGHFSPDSINQYEQATGLIPLSDWHPPFMTILWQLLINLSGKISSMLALQLALLVGSTFLVSLYIFKMGSKWFFGLLPYVFLIYPGVLNIAGVIWKDILMADMFLLGSALLLWVRYVRFGKRVRIVCLVAAATFFVAGSMIRYNAIIAALPFFVMTSREAVSGKYRRAIVSGSLVALVIILPLSVAALANVQKDHPLTAIMLDDLVHITNSTKSKQSEVAKTISNVRYACKDWAIPMNGYIACTSVEQKQALRSNYAELTRLWVSGITKHPIEYLKFRGKVFVYFLFPPKERFYIYADGIVQNTYGLNLRNPDASAMVGQYVRNFSDMGGMFMFQGWFWLLVSLIMIGTVMKSQLEEKIFVLSVLFSGILYIAGYYFVAVETDYRYIYWPVCATLLAIIMYVSLLHTSTRPTIITLRKALQLK